MKIIMLGAPGAGKGTQAKKIAEKYSIPHISTGDIFRANIKNNTELGKKAKTYMDKGELVPDELVVDLIMDRFKDADCANGYVLDGFPRTIPQAEALDKALAANNEAVDFAINVEVPDENIINRMSGRRACVGCGGTYHIRESAAVVVPVAAERGVHAVFVVGFVGRRAEPHVVVQLFRDGLGLEVLLPHPEEFPGESRGSGDGHLEGPSQQAAVDEFLERFDRRAQSVEGVLEAEPGVQAEDASVLPDGLHHALALADGARHRLLAPDVLAGLGCLDGHDAVPVGRGGDVYDVDVGVGDQIPVVVIAFEGLVELLAAQRDGAFEVFAVDVADRHQAACIVGGEVIAALADAAHADDALRELVARGDEFGASEHAARHDGQQRQPACLFQKISAVTHSISGCVFFLDAVNKIGRENSGSVGWEPPFVYRVVSRMLRQRTLMPPPS